jgi:hypothetical protein
MAHGTPLGLADNDERYGAQGAFLIEAGISSSYHIANFFGLTDWIRPVKEVANEPAKQVAKQPAKPIPLVAASSAPTPDIASVLWPQAGFNREPSRLSSRGGIDVGGVITRALTAAGLMK